MADTFYPYSRQEAELKGELDRWEKNHRANVKCARDIENLIAAHARSGRLEPDCAKVALDWWGFLRVRYVMASTLVRTGGLGFEPDSLKWARTVYVPPDKANGEFNINVDRPLLAEFVRQAHTEYQKLGMFGAEHCAAGNLDYTGRVLILRPDVLKEEYWAPQNQLWYGEGGFGCSPTARGQAVYATCLGDGEKTRWNRTDFTGVLDEQYLPDWAAEKLAALRGSAQEQTDGPGQGGMEMR